MNDEQLKLENQLCFPVYAASRLIIREYQPLLDKLGITYPQYLVLMVLWESDEITVNEIARKLILNTNTITPLLKRMESLGIILRERSKSDERKVVIRLTSKGKDMKTEAGRIPGELAAKINSEVIGYDQLLELKNTLTLLISSLNSDDRDGSSPKNP
ncbi:MAG: MarR family winged helix-turn-helix transcriptional regulator [Bacteroidota bacterium]